MATIGEIQKRLDNRTLDPFALTPEQRNAIDSAIDDGILKEIGRASCRERV